MNILGIIAEYNPFHNGHLYHLNSAKLKVNADYTICVMSGNFIQRGEPALINKFIRSDMAIKNGIDLVIELPVYYSNATAEKFAYAGVKLLNECNANFISFGCESDDIQTLTSVSNLLSNETYEYQNELKKHLNLGLSYPDARSKTISKLLNISAHILNQPNNVLAIEYLKAISKINPEITPVPIQRVDSNYYDTDSKTNILSATGIREKLKNSEDIDIFLPQNSLNLLENPIFMQDFEQLILFSLRKLSIDDLKNLPDVTEGLENRIFSAIIASSTLSELIDKIKTKRYPLTRIKRILISALLSLSKETLTLFDKLGGPQYLRVLGCNEKGKELLSLISKKSTLPIVTSINKFLYTASEPQKEMLSKDILATNIYTLISKDKTMNLDYTRRI